MMRRTSLPVFIRETPPIGPQVYQLPPFLLFTGSDGVDARFLRLPMPVGHLENVITFSDRHPSSPFL